MAADQQIDLKEYIDRRFEDFEKLTTERFRLSDTAITKAEGTMNERLRGMNEFRSTIQDLINRVW